MKKEINETPNWLIVIIIVLIILVFIISLGQLDVKNNVKLPQAFKDDNEEAKRKYEKLKQIIDRKKKLKKKLERRFKWIFFSVRLAFLSLWGGYLLLLTMFSFISNLEDAINYSEAIILTFAALNFLTFGSFTNVEKFINSIKIRLKNWIWGKYLNIQKEIELDSNELAALMIKNDYDKTNESNSNL